MQHSSFLNLCKKENKVVAVYHSVFFNTATVGAKASVK